MEIDNEVRLNSENMSKKRKRRGRMSDVLKKIRLEAHEPGSDCMCRNKCFEKVSVDSRKKIIKNFNLLPSHDAQNAHLGGLISVLPVARKSVNGSRNNEASYKYRVLAEQDDTLSDIIVCKKAFLSIHGITRKKVEYIVASLKSSGIAPSDKRGRHGKQPQFCEEKRSLIRQHINSFKSRKSHYSLHDTSKRYLPEELNVKKMFRMFTSQHPTVTVSYETYRSIFVKDFNISFGYPRTDTCSTCDEYMAKIKAIEAEKKSSPSCENSVRLDSEIQRLENENRVHRIRAQVFYDRKKNAKNLSKTSTTKEAICIDYGKNLPVPNITTNDVYYKRQLSQYLFNVHILSTSQSVIYTYPETEGKKGSDDVCSLLHHFMYNYLKPSVKELHIFCDSCSGQNKNHTMFRFLHHLVNIEKRLDYIKVTFPIRGHSYMECDKNMGLINSKARAETPEEWIKIFKQARSSPSAFDVVKVDYTYFRSWTKHLDTIYVKKSSFPSRPIKELKVKKEANFFIGFRTSYNGTWEKASVKGKKKNVTMDVEPNEFKLPSPSYKSKIAIKREKFEDIQALKVFCGPKAAEYLSNLPHL